MTANYRDQLARARALLDEKGVNALENPHAATGRICRCRDCFCCAALQVLYDYRDKLVETSARTILFGN